MWHHTAPHNYIHKRNKTSSETTQLCLSFPDNQMKETQARLAHLESKKHCQPLTSNSITISCTVEVLPVSTLEWGSVSSSWLELEGEGVADLLPGGEGEPWGSVLRLTWGFSWDSTLMGLDSIGGELFIRGWLQAGS